MSCNQLEMHSQPIPKSHEQLEKLSKKTKKNKIFLNETLKTINSMTGTNS